jgi:hypothetical protein
MAEGMAQSDVIINLCRLQKKLIIKSSVTKSL